MYGAIQRVIADLEDRECCARDDERGCAQVRYGRLPNYRWLGMMGEAGVRVDGSVDNNIICRRRKSSSGGNAFQ